MTGLWKTWMTIWCWAVGLFGLVLAGAGLPATEGPTRLLFGILGDPAAFHLDDQARFTIALMGAVTLGWALTMATAIKAATALGAAGRPVWSGLTVSLLVWFVIDSSLSVATGYPLNAGSNTVILVTYLLPLWRSGVLGRG